MKATKEIPIYLTKRHNVRQIDVVQHDTGIQLVFSVLDFAIPSGASATLYVQKPSGKFVYQEEGLTVTGSTVTVDLHNQAITEHGKVPYQVSIQSGSDVITTFTGLIMVEKSLKDAGATESKTVIRAFDEAVSAHVAEFQAKAEQIVQACIATIPEDYSTMEAKVNESANAVKGYLSGAVVAADDVSPVEHSPAVKIHGKNLVPYGTITFTKNKSILLDNPLPEGTYTISAQITSNDTDSEYSAVSINSKSEVVKYIALKRGTRVSSTFTATKPITNLDFCAAYNYSQGEADSATWADIQIEEGTVATDYEPYIDPSTVTVTRFGKNLQKNDSSTQTINGVTFTVNSDGSVTANGTATSDARFLIYKRVPIKGATKCILNGAPSGANETTYFLHTVMAWDGIDHSFYDYGNGREIDVGGTITASTVSITVKTGVTVSGLVFRPMIRIASIADGSFESYTEQTAVPTADGTVPGITSLSPSMTILTDTEGVIVECEYNRDTNKVIEKLTNAIKALGGTI
jgi:hypothetical protein